MTRYVYVGSQAGDEDASIFVYRMDSETGALTPVHQVRGGANPSFMTVDPLKQFLFCVNETDDGAVSSFHIDRRDGGLRFINRIKVGGDWPCYLSLAPDRKKIITTNYGSGSVTVLPVSADGALSERDQQIQHAGAAVDLPRSYSAHFIPLGKTATAAFPGIHAVPPGVIASRQERPHPHSVVFAPGGNFALAADLGMDRVWVYRYANGELDISQGGWDGKTAQWNEDPWEVNLADAQWQSKSGHNLKPGSGPRHIAFHPNAKHVYVSAEMGSLVTVFAWDGRNGALKAAQNCSTLPDDFDGHNDVAHLAFHPDGKRLYVSNRGHNSIAVFEVNADDGTLRPAGRALTRGGWPRNFCVDSEGRFLLVANQNSGSVVVMRIDPQSGGLTPTGEEIAVPTPFFIMTVDLD